MTACILLLGVCMAGGVFCFWAGYTTAEKKHLLMREQENEKVEQVLRTYAGVDRRECLERLHDKPR